MAFTAGSTYKIFNVDNININGDEYVIPGNILDQGVSVSFAPDQTQAVANGATVVKNEKISVSFTLLGDAVTINEFVGYIDGYSRYLTYLDINLDDGDALYKPSSFRINRLVIQANEVVKTNDLLKLVCSIEISAGDADNEMSFTPRTPINA
jgi:hypothetical protein